MGILDKIFSDTSDTSDTCFEIPQRNGNQSENEKENEKEKRIYAECRDNVSLPSQVSLPEIVQVTHNIGFDGEKMVLLPVCRDCSHFTPDSINPREGIGHCQSFPSPYNPAKQMIRYPMQDPKNPTCFEREETR